MKPALDGFHTLARGTDLGAMRAIPRDRIFLVQMADAPRLDMDFLSWSRHYRCFCRCCKKKTPGDFPDFRFHGCAAGDRVLTELYFRSKSSPTTASAPATARAASPCRRPAFAAGDDRRIAGAHRRRGPRLPGNCRRAGLPRDRFRSSSRWTTPRPPGSRNRVAAAPLRQDGRPQRQNRRRDWPAGRHQLRRQPREGRSGFAHSFNITHGSSVCALTL